MSVFKKHRRYKFTQVDNEVIIRPDLSAKSKGILLYLMSKPETWKPNIRDISNNMLEGYKAINSGMHELVELGYAKMYPTKLDDGSFSGTTWEVCDVPLSELPKSGNSQNRKLPKSETPKNGNYKEVKRINTKKEKRLKLIKTLEENTRIPFMIFWTDYKRKVGDRSKCEDFWYLKLNDEEREAIIQFIPNYLKYEPRVKFRRLPMSFFNSRFWESDLTQSDEVPAPGQSVVEGQLEKSSLVLEILELEDTNDERDS